ncbi:MAG: hypothetical protein RIS64_945 [Bacteroidota bacterium]|jgi:hypothetical protein
MQFQILTQEPMYKMSRWTMIKWVFRGIAFLLIALLISVMIALWTPPNAPNNGSAAPKESLLQASPEPVSQEVKKRNSF